jgi:hypothetical protein
MNEDKGNFRDEIFSKSVRAGKRTYFFDVKSTRGGDLYLTITESKKRFQDDGNFYFEKHKLFLYKEDFDKFSDGLTEVIDKIAELKENSSFQQEPYNKSEQTTNTESEESNKDSINEETNSSDISDESNGNEFKEVDFDDLGK